MVFGRVMFALTVVALATTAVFAQGNNVPDCVSKCLTSGFKSAGCSNNDFVCACKNGRFNFNTDSCFRASCDSFDDQQIGENMVNIGCSNEASTSISPPFPTSGSTSSSLSVTNSETSPPQSSSTRGRPNTSLVPPIPPLTSDTGSASTTTSTRSSVSTTTTVVVVTPTPSSSTSVSVVISTSTQTAPGPSSSSSSSSVSRNVASGTDVSSGVIQQVPTAAPTSGAQALVVHKLFWKVGMFIMGLYMM